MASLNDVSGYGAKPASCAKSPLAVPLIARPLVSEIGHWDLVIGHFFDWGQVNSLKDRCGEGNVL